MSKGNMSPQDRTTTELGTEKVIWFDALTLDPGTLLERSVPGSRGRMRALMSLASH